ncbi:ferrous iron transport protein B [Coprobacter fastidiosus]|uniref:ferrous iron transport protein B n=1 Tax=Coprobacter fastidiosus TaxID=1099853 RepID=UPI000EFF8A77|nr:ferrous iron transport protein B [Coprobacter fastidiosus]RHO61645.1 ferrous iron transport protein B [Tannerella sp. AM09-19]
MRLSDLQTGDEAVIVKVLGHGAFRKRITEMGFVRGKKVSVLLNAPLKDPIKYKILDYEVSLRRSEASMIEVLTENEAVDLVSCEDPNVLQNDDVIGKAVVRSGKTINIALVGNPNCGKTSLFNVASGSHEHVGNYSGVTVDAKKGYFNYKGYHFNIYDLPGTYSLSAYSPEELYVRRHIFEQTPDVIVNVVVASNLERNLYLTTELIDMDLSMVIALNMYDELEQSGAVLDYKTLGEMIGVPIVPTVSRSGKGIDNLFDTIIRVYENQDLTVRHIHINHGKVIESGINVLKEELKTDPQIKQHFSPRYLAIKLLEGDEEVESILKDKADYNDLITLRNREVQRISKTLGEDVETAVSNEKYGFISGALKETLIPGDREKARTTHIIDSLVTNKLFGFPIFILLMWVMFEATFKLGAYPMEWIESGVAWIGSLVERYMSDGPLKDLIVDGVIGGVGGVIVFLPNILILYLFISFMEDSGYMARAAFIMDKIMHRIGLHGKSFIPLVMGFGCNVPAIMASRTIESRSSRLITILINPFMSCSARLPIYVLLIGTFFPDHASLVFIGLYLLGIIVAIITARLLRKFLFKKDETPFVMELPPYRIPTAKATLRHMWGKAEQYLKKMGGLILVASIIIWFLSYYPRTSISDTVSETTVEESFVQQQNSYIGRIGQFIEPVLEPLGFNWKVSIALISGTAAKELVVSTIGVLYSEAASDDDATLSAKLTAPNPQTGHPDFTPLIAISFMAFVLLYIPCIATIVAVANEAGSWKWGLFTIIYNTGVAWIVSFLIYNIGKLFI